MKYVCSGSRSSTYVSAFMKQIILWGKVLHHCDVDEIVRDVVLFIAGSYVLSIFICFPPMWVIICCLIVSQHEWIVCLMNRSYPSEQTLCDKTDHFTPYWFHPDTQTHNCCPRHKMVRENGRKHFCIFLYMVMEGIVSLWRKWNTEEIYEGKFK